MRAACGLNDRVRTHSVILDQLEGIAGLSETVVDADELDRHRMVLRENFGDARAHAGLALVLFDGNDRAAAARGVDDCGLVHRFDRVVVYDAAFDAVLRGKPVGGNQRVVDENTAGDDRYVAASRKI